MTAEVEFGPDVEIAHVLCIDIVGYSKLATNEQSTLLRQLNEIVRNTPSFCRAEVAGKLLRLPTGDGMVLVFFTNPQAPVQCALDISQALQKRNDIAVRMGVHSGPVDRVSDIDERFNLAGAGINIAQRVMDCGDAGHILLSKRVAEDLGQYTQWQPHLHGLGECEVKHGAKVELYNVYTSAIGNAKVPEKVRRDQRRRIQAARQRRKLAFIALLAVALIALTGVWLWQHATGSTVERSIAVLPFENLSAEKENGYFAGGIQDEILTNLAKIGDLKVISRSSVMIYATNRPNIRDIAKAIGVAAVVEGSVQRVANRVRINVQLVNAANDQHIWAEHYEKDVSDIFAAQRDVAFEIASSLHAQLSPAEKTRLERRPTSNGAAYLIYLQAQDLYARAQSLAEIEKMAQLYQKAVELDPAFALAFAQLAYMEALIYFNRGTSLPLERAQMAANEALRLQPDLPEGHFALGYIYFLGQPRLRASARPILYRQAWIAKQCRHCCRHCHDSAQARQVGRVDQALRESGHPEPKRCNDLEYGFGRELPGIARIPERSKNARPRYRNGLQFLLQPYLEGLDRYRLERRYSRDGRAARQNP